MANTKRKQKKTRVKPRFFIIIFIGLIAGGIFYQVNGRNQEEAMPNFHGWLSTDVEAFVYEQPNMSVMFEFEHSPTIEPTRVMSQSIEPGRIIGGEAVVVSVTISLGQEVN